MMNTSKIRWKQIHIFVHHKNIFSSSSIRLTEQPHLCSIHFSFLFFFTFQLCENMWIVDVHNEICCWACKVTILIKDYTTKMASIPYMKTSSSNTEWNSIKFMHHNNRTWCCMSVCVWWWWLVKQLTASVLLCALNNKTVYCLLWFLVCNVEYTIWKGLLV